MRPLLLPVLACASLLSGRVEAADDTSREAIADARKYAQAVLGEDCSVDPAMYGDDAAFADTATTLEWDASWTDEKQRGTLYSIFCFQGAYNTGHAYAFKSQDYGLQMVAFAEPSLDFDYADDDNTALKAPPVVKGFTASMLLINSEFDPATKTIVSASRWRGLGDAWDSGEWLFEAGKFVLKKYTVDPTYEANMENPPDEAIDKFFVVYEAP